MLVQLILIIGMHDRSLHFFRLAGHSSPFHHATFPLISRALDVRPEPKKRQVNVDQPCEQLLPLSLSDSSHIIILDE